MTLPEIELHLKKIALVLGIMQKHINEIAGEIPRRKPTRKSKPTSTPMTPQIARGIRATAKANPDWSYVKIAKKYNVNSGRVSEAIRGKRK